MAKEKVFVRLCEHKASGDIAISASGHVTGTIDLSHLSKYKDKEYLHVLEHVDSRRIGDSLLRYYHPGLVKYLEEHDNINDIALDTYWIKLLRNLDLPLVIYDFSLKSIPMSKVSKGLNRPMTCPDIYKDICIMLDGMMRTVLDKPMLDLRLLYTVYTSEELDLVDVVPFQGYSPAMLVLE